MADFKYEIVKKIAVLSESDNGYTTEVNIISYNGAKPKLDIRKWNRNSDKMLKGITLTADEVEALREALSSVNAEDLA